MKKNRQLSFEEAKKICNEYLHLKEHVLSEVGNYKETVEHIVVAPRNVAQQPGFLKFCLEMIYSNAVLQHYSYYDYTVIGIIKQAHTDGQITYRFLSLETLARLSGV